MKEEAASPGYILQYLNDDDQGVVKVYQAACTPEFHLSDTDRTLCYCGQLDASRSGNAMPVDGSELHRAIDAVLAGGRSRMSTGPNCLKAISEEHNDND